MFLPGRVPEPLDALLSQLNDSARRLLPTLSGPCLPLLPGADGFDIIPYHQFAMVVTGQLDISRHGRIVLVLQPGDLLANVAAFSGGQLVANSDERCELRLIDPRAPQNREAEDTLWDHLLLSWSVLAYATALSQRGALRPTAGFTRFAAGDAILKQGDEAEHVMTMMRGNANVVVDGTRVGTVLEGEIFGVLGPLTGEKRNASVIANADCTVMMIPATQFIELIRVQPETCLRLMQMMARQISELNRKVARKLSLVT